MLQITAMCAHLYGLDESASEPSILREKLVGLFNKPFDKEAGETLDETLDRLAERYNFTLAQENTTETQNPFVALLFDQSETDFEHAVRRIEERYKELPVILLYRENTPHDYVEIINRLNVFRLHALEDGMVGIQKGLAEAYSRHQTGLEKQKLLNSIREKSENLQRLNRDLDQIVRERTKHISDSKRRSEQDIESKKRFVSYLKELSRSTSVEQLLRLLGEEVRLWKSSAFAHLVMEETGHWRLFYFQGQQLVHKKVSAPRLIHRIAVSAAEDQVYLANSLSRPVGSVISVPLVPTRNNDFSVGKKAVLLIEHTMRGQEVDRFIEHLARYLQPFLIALDRVNLEKELKSASQAWEKTFDGIDDAIAIIDSELKIMRKNHVFKSIDEESDREFSRAVLTRVKTITEGQPLAAKMRSDLFFNEQIYELHSYPVGRGRNLQSSISVVHIPCVTHARELRSRLIQNEKMVAIGNLAGKIAHELNNPLTGIHSMAQILMAQLVEEQVAQESSLYADFAEIEKAAVRSQNIIKNLLEFSGESSDSYNQDIEVNDLIVRTLPLLKTAMRSHQCLTDLSTSKVYVEGHPQMLQQVIFNLVNNACQAMLEVGEIQLAVEAHESWVNVIVKDNGPGISAADQERIFEPFFTTKEEGKGTGLGLYMSRNLVRKMGGDLSLTSSDSSGTTFTISLKRAIELRPEASQWEVPK